MPTPFLPVPDWFPFENEGADIAVGDLDGDGNPDLVVLHIDAPEGPNHAYYRVGWGLTAEDGITGDWGAWVEVPDWFAWTNQGAGVAIADVDGNGKPDIVVFQVDDPAGKNEAYWRVAYNVDEAGAPTEGWGPWHQVPDWFPFENQGAAITIADVDGNGQPDLVVFQIDAPFGPNQGYYRIGRDLDAWGAVTGGWTDWQTVPDWFFWENQGGGIAVADLDGNGRPEIIAFHIDNPFGPNGGYYSVGWDVAPESGVATGGWGTWQQVPDWPQTENQYGGLAVSDLDGDGHPQLVVFQIDNPAGQNAGLYRVIDFAPNGANAAVEGAWRLLQYDSQVLAMHAALLHTNKVLFFSGSSNNPANLPNDFRSSVWDLQAGTMTRPQTPIDFFCAGHAFLADGRLLVAGGTKTYDPFTGLTDVYAFDPADDQWHPLPFMTGGRWYPTLVTLGDGSILAMSGVGEQGEFPYQPLELYTDPLGWTTLPAALERPWPLYAHLFLLRDGRLFYTGGQYNENFGLFPCLIDLHAETVVDVPGLPDRDNRNQSASIFLPPVQDGKIMIIGGGADYADHGHHHHAHGTIDQVSIVEPLADPPHFHDGPHLNLARMHHCAIALPDRTVLICGGSAEDESRELATLNGEIYDPATNAWTVVAAARYPRLYHSVSLLLPDGRVMTSGSNPDRGDEDLRIELYHPAYLFKGGRPSITAAPESLAYGEEFTIESPQAGDIKWVSIIRASSTTHTLDTDQRLVDVPFTLNGAGLITATMTTEPSLAPPGRYMLFITDNAGIPSTASWLSLSGPLV